MIKLQLTSDDNKEYTFVYSSNVLTYDPSSIVLRHNCIVLDKNIETLTLIDSLHNNISNKKCLIPGMIKERGTHIVSYAKLGEWPESVYCSRFNRVYGAFSYPNAVKKYYLNNRWKYKIKGSNISKFIITSLFNDPEYFPDLFEMFHDVNVEEICRVIMTESVNSNITI